MTHPRPALASLLCTLLVSCGDPVGGGVDGNPNFLEGRLTLSDGTTPAVGALVVASIEVPAAARALGDGSAEDSARTDSQGRFRLRPSSDGTWLLRAFAGDSLLLSRLVKWRGSEGLRLADAVVPVEASDSVLVDDFEPAGSSRGLSAWSASLQPWRFLVPDSTNLVVAPIGQDTLLEVAIEDCAERGGRCIHLSGTSRDSLGLYTHARAYHLLGTESGRCIDPSIFDSLRAAVSGTGRVELALWVTGSGSGSTWTRMDGREFPLEGAWTDVAMAFADLEFRDDADQVVPLSSTCLHKVSIGLLGNADLRFDDVRLSGATALELQLR
ncbi:MAG: hypothetical protein H6686_01290 [Fibrobacteria bacterium]|nr:hypothetical protein [Fibrobacteria bacterium]